MKDHTADRGCTHLTWVMVVEAPSSCPIADAPNLPKVLSLKLCHVYQLDNEHA